MVTLSVDVDEAVENYLRRKDIDTISYLANLIKKDMIQDQSSVSHEH